jgi:hypothetical protein
VVVSIHQLHYLPWLRYFEKIAAAEVFIVLDNIQYNKNGWQNRNRIKTSTSALLLTVPVREKAAQRLDEVMIVNDTPWRAKHLRSLEQAYRRAPFFEQHNEFLRGTYGREWIRLNDLNRHMLQYFVRALDIRTKIIYASDLNVSGTATDRLINLIRAVGGDTYYSGAHAVETYLDAPALAAAGIALQFQHWQPPQYPQLHRPFISDLSIIDLLMNCGPRSMQIIQGNAA